MKKITPFGNRVLVKLADSEEKTKSGLFIPATATELPVQVKVVAIGQGKTENGKLVPINLKTGDIVLLSQFGGTIVELNDVKYKMVDADSILGVIS